MGVKCGRYFCQVWLHTPRGAPRPRPDARRFMPSDIVVDRAFVQQERERAAARAARFSNAGPPPPLPKRSMAWPGGKLTTNKATAVQKFLRRKKGDLTKEQRKRLKESLQARGSASVQSVQATSKRLAASQRAASHAETRPARTIRLPQRRRQPLRWRWLSPWAHHTSAVFKFIVAKRRPAVARQWNPSMKPSYDDLAFAPGLYPGHTAR